MVAALSMHDLLKVLVPLLGLHLWVMNAQQLLSGSDPIGPKRIDGVGLESEDELDKNLCHWLRIGM